MQTQIAQQQQRTMKRNFRCLQQEENNAENRKDVMLLSSPDDAAQILLSLSTSSPKKTVDSKVSPKNRTKRAIEDEEAVSKTTRKNELRNQRNKRSRVAQPNDVSSKSRGGTPTLISDDEHDDEVGHRPSVVVSKKKFVLPAANTPPDPSDWRSITRPLGLPPRLPRLPAGMTFPKPSYLK